MKITAPLVLMILLALTLLTPPVTATHFCNGNGIVLVMGDQTYLALDEIAGPESLFSIWGYMETNGIPGLQRGGITLLGDADVCQDSPTPDTGLF